MPRQSVDRNDVRNRQWQEPATPRHSRYIQNQLNERFYGGDNVNWLRIAKTLINQVGPLRVSASTSRTVAP
jgi:hypothetical protein